MTAKRKGLTFLDTRDAAPPAPPKRSGPVTLAQKRDAMAARRSPDIAKLSDEEIELLWGSLDDEARRQYLGE